MDTTFILKVQLALCFFIISSVLGVTSQITYLNYICFAPYTNRIDYETNIEKAITQLTLEASNTYFSTNTTGLGQDQVNAFFNCRYDVSPQICQSCVASAAKNITLCLSSVEGIVYYEECSLHYANLSLSSIMVEKPRYYQVSHRTANLEIYFSRILSEAVTDLIGNVTSEYPVSSRYFSTTTAKYGSQDTIYALAQCNPDITSLNCSSCLRNGFSTLSTNYTGSIYGQFFSPICRLSYILSGEVLSRPWSFQRTFDQSPLILSAGIRGSSIIGAMITSILGVAMCLKFLL